LQEDRFLNLQIPLPPLPEQRRIVARIEELAAKINEARGLRQKAAQEAEAFVISFHAKLAGTRMKNLKDVLRLDEDTTSVTSTGSYPQVGVKSFGAGLFAKGAVTGSETTYKAFNRLYEGALVLSQVKGWEGAVAICPAKLAGWFVSPEYRTFRCVEDQARPGYLASLVRTRWFWEKLGSATRGVGARRERTRPEQFLNIEITIPTIEKQVEGECVFAGVDALKKLQAETATELAALLSSILDKAFKGAL
jgi:type I restriction enzyme S subunit